MNPPEDVFDQQLADFQEKLSAMTHHQLHVLASVSANRMQEDLAQGRKPDRWQQHLKRFVRRAKRYVAFRFKPVPASFKKPDEEAVVIIDATYTVVTEDATPKATTPSKENKL